MLNSVVSKRQTELSFNRRAVDEFQIFCDGKERRDFSRISPSVITQGIIWKQPEVKEKRKTVAGLFVETVNDKKSSQLLKTKKIGIINIEVVLYGMLITSKNVCRDLLNY